MSTTIEYLPSATFDIIENLPVDEKTISQEDIQIIDTLFQEKPSVLKSLMREIKSIVLLVILFIMFSLPYIDMIVNKIINIPNNSTYILVSVKAVIFAFLYYFINNWYLTKKHI